MSFDAIVIGSGFGGAITACRLAEAGMKVLILERGRRWDNKPGPGVTAYPREIDDPWIWDHNRPQEHNGWLDLRVFDGMSVAQGAAVGGGSLIYASISVEAPDLAFLSGWPAEITKAELKRYYKRVADFMGTAELPNNQWNPRTHLMKEAAEKIGAGERFKLISVAVNFDPALNLDPDNPPTEASSKIERNQHGVLQGTCIHRGQCDIGCPVKAKNTLDVNYIPVAERNGAEVRPLHLVRKISPPNEKDGQRRYTVYFDELRDGALIPGCESAEFVVVAAGSLGSTELLLRCRDQFGMLPGLSPCLGKGWSSNGDFLVPAFYPFRKVFPEVGPTISSAIDFLDGSRENQVFWVEDGGFPPVFRHHAAASKADRESHACEKLITWMQREVKDVAAELTPSEHIMPWFAQAIDAGDGQLELDRPSGCFRLRWDVTRSLPTFDAVINTHKQLSRATGGVPLVSPLWTLGRAVVTPHPLGGCNMGTDSSNGVVDHKGEVFGYENLYVIDGAIVPRPLGVNPSRTIGALAERCAEIIVSAERKTRPIEGRVRIASYSRRDYF